mgnify:CR=1 FL=1
MEVSEVLGFIASPKVGQNFDWKEEGETKVGQNFDWKEVDFSGLWDLRRVLEVLPRLRGSLGRLDTE